MINIKSIKKFKSFTSSEEIVLIIFYSDTCMSSKIVIENLKFISDSHNIAKIDAVSSPIAMDQNINASPTLIFYQSGKQLDRMIGVQTVNTIKNKIDILNKEIRNV